MFTCEMSDCDDMATHTAVFENETLEICDSCAEYWDGIDGGLVSLTPYLSIAINTHRNIWAEIAKKNDWYAEPFFIQVWVDPTTNKIYDSVATRDLTKDVIVYEPEEADND
jgi:hypothetical protein